MNILSVSLLDSEIVRSDILRTMPFGDMVLIRSDKLYLCGLIETCLGCR